MRIRCLMGTANCSRMMAIGITTIVFLDAVVVIVGMKTGNNFL